MQTKRSVHNLERTYIWSAETQAAAEWWHLCSTLMRQQNTPDAQKLDRDCRYRSCSRNAHIDCRPWLDRLDLTFSRTSTSSPLRCHRLESSKHAVMGCTPVLAVDTSLEHACVRIVLCREWGNNNLLYKRSHPGALYLVRISLFSRMALVPA